MNRIVGLTVIAGFALAGSAAVRRLLRGRRDKANSALQAEIERFENEGGHVAPVHVAPV